jgi:hypothetical protein
LVRAGHWSGSSLENDEFETSRRRSQRPGVVPPARDAEYAATLRLKGSEPFPGRASEAALYWLSMIFSENRHPLFRIML